MQHGLKIQYGNNMVIMTMIFDSVVKCIYQALDHP